MTLKRRMLLNMISVVAISGGVSAFIGGYLLRWHLQREAEQRVQQDLYAAQEFYDQRLRVMESALQYTGLGERFSEAVSTKDMRYLTSRLNVVRKSAIFDLLCVTDPEGRVIHRAHKPDYSGDSLAEDSLLGLVLGGAEAASGTILVPIETLEREGSRVAESAKISTLPTPKARTSGVEKIGSGMMLASAARVRGPDGNLAGVLRGGILLNGNYDLVDQVLDTVFQEERYRGKLLGTATIFQDDVRISTNVEAEDGSRAIGTRISAEVYDHVLTHGNTWVGRSWVVNDWYITACAPIRNPDKRTIGIFAVGVLQRKFSDIAVKTYTIFALVTFLGLAAATVVAWRVASSISRPVTGLASASAAIARGELSQVVPVESEDEIGLLAENFNIMARSLRERDRLLREKTQQQLSRSEHLASVGRLAAGIAHEINNPLTGVLTFAHMLRRNVSDDSSEASDIDTIIEATTRCREIVRGLLDFSRQSEARKKPSDLNEVLREAMKLTKNQGLVKSVNMEEVFESHLPSAVIDPNQIEQVAVNLMCNAIDAMPDGGTVTVRSSTARENGRLFVAFEVSDSGRGIPEEALDKVFDPFFTTKPAGKGTGLGLAVAHGIIEKHGGHISLSSVVNSGTTVAVRLPLSPEE
ncbi:cache domain-containing protein [Planctomycetota bacterium]